MFWLSPFCRVDEIGIPTKTKNFLKMTDKLYYIVLYRIRLVTDRNWTQNFSCDRQIGIQILPCNHGYYDHRIRSVSNVNLKDFCISVIHMVGLWCLMPLSTIFRLYRGCQFYWCMKPEYPVASHRQSIEYTLP